MARDQAIAEPVIVRRIVAEMTKRGLDTSTLCQGLGFDLADLESVELRVSYGQVRTVIRRAMPLLGDPQLALHLGSSANLVSWGFVYLGMMASAKSRAVLEFAVDFLPSTGRFIHIHGEDDAGQFSIVVDALFDEPDVFSFLVDVTFGSLMQVCHQVVDPAFGPISVDLTMARPHDAKAYESVFACPVQFGQALNRMNFLLRSEKVASADTVVAKRTRQFLVLERAGANNVSELEAEVVRAVRGDLESPPALPDIAKSMHMSERTLRRRLADAGLAFSDVLERERMRRALHLIREGKMPMSQVASQAGYADSRGLRRAIKRWSGRNAAEIEIKNTTQ